MNPIVTDEVVRNYRDSLSRLKPQLPENARRLADTEQYFHFGEPVCLRGQVFGGLSIDNGNDSAALQISATQMTIDLVNEHTRTKATIEYVGPVTFKADRDFKEYFSTTGPHVCVIDEISVGETGGCLHTIRWVNGDGEESHWAMGSSDLRLSWCPL